MASAWGLFLPHFADDLPVNAGLEAEVELLHGAPVVQILLAVLFAQAVLGGG